MWGRIVVPNTLSDVDAVLYYCATTGAGCRFSSRATLDEIASGADLSSAAARAAMANGYFTIEAGYVLLTPAGLQAAAALMGPLIARSPMSPPLVWTGDEGDVRRLAEIIEDVDRGQRCLRASVVEPPRSLTDLTAAVDRDLEAAAAPSPTSSEPAVEIPTYPGITYRGVVRGIPRGVDERMSQELRVRPKLIAGRDLPADLRAVIIASRAAEGSGKVHYAWPTSMNGMSTWMSGDDLADVAAALAAMDETDVLYAVQPNRVVVAYTPVPREVSEGDYSTPSRDDEDDAIPASETDTSIFPGDAEVTRVDRLRKHSLLTREILARLPKIGSTDKQSNPIAQVKFFSAVHGRATWFLTEYNPKTHEAFGWAVLEAGLGELGYIDVHELATMMVGPKVRIGGRVVQGTPIPAVERDLYWRPRPLREAICEADPASSPDCDERTRKPFPPEDLEAIEQFNAPSTPQPTQREAFHAAAQALYDGVQAPGGVPEGIVLRGDKIAEISASYSPNRVLVPETQRVTFSVNVGAPGYQMLNVEFGPPKPDANAVMLHVYKSTTERNPIWTAAVWLGTGQKSSTSETVAETIDRIRRLAVDEARSQSEAGVLWTIVEPHLDTKLHENVWFRKDRPEPDDLTREDIVKLLKVRRIQDPQNRHIPVTARPHPTAGWELTYNEEADLAGYEGTNDNLAFARMHDVLRSMFAVQAAFSYHDLWRRVREILVGKKPLTTIRQDPGAFKLDLFDLPEVRVQRPVDQDRTVSAILKALDVRDVPMPIPDRKQTLAANVVLPGAQLLHLHRSGPNTTAYVTTSRVVIYQDDQPYNCQKSNPNYCIPRHMMDFALQRQGFPIPGGRDIHAEDVEKIATWAAVITARVEAARPHLIRVGFSDGAAPRAVIDRGTLDVHATVYDHDGKEVTRTISPDVFRSAPAVVQVGPRPGEIFRSWQIDAIKMVLEGITPMVPKAAPTEPPDSPKHSLTYERDYNAVLTRIRRLFHGEQDDPDEISRGVIQLTTRENGDVGEETAGQADIDAARAAVRRIESEFPWVVGEVQVVDEWVSVILRDRVPPSPWKRAPSPSAGAPAGAPPTTPAPATTPPSVAAPTTPPTIRSDLILNVSVSRGQGKASNPFVASHTAGDYVAVWDAERPDADRWLVVHRPSGRALMSFPFATLAFNLVDALQDIHIPGTISDAEANRLLDRWKERETQIRSARRRDGSPPDNAGPLVILRHAFLRSPVIRQWVAWAEGAGLDLFAPKTGIVDAIADAADEGSNREIDNPRALAVAVVTRLSADPATVATDWARDLPVSARAAVRSLWPFTDEDRAYLHRVNLEDTASVEGVGWPFAAVASNGSLIALARVDDPVPLNYRRRGLDASADNPIAPAESSLPEHAPFPKWPNALPSVPWGPPSRIPPIGTLTGGAKAWADAYTMPDKLVARLGAMQQDLAQAEQRLVEVKAQGKRRVDAARGEPVIAKPWRLTGVPGRKEQDFKTLKLAQDAAKRDNDGFIMFRKDAEGVYYAPGLPYRITDLSAGARERVAEAKRIATAVERDVAEAGREVVDLREKVERITRLDRPIEALRYFDLRDGAVHIGLQHYPETLVKVADLPGAVDAPLGYKSWLDCLEFIGPDGTIQSVPTRVSNMVRLASNDGKRIIFLMGLRREVREHEA